MSGHFHFEVVQSSAAQPWHARIQAANGLFTWTTGEPFEDDDSAYAAILALVHEIGGREPYFDVISGLRHIVLPLDDSETIIHIVECARCAVDFGIGADFMRRRREDHQRFYCPNGHTNVYNGPSENERRATLAEQERDAARSLAQREARRRQDAEAGARLAEYQRRAAKGQLTRLRKRIANGVCPCCNRSFKNVRDHIAHQHPEFKLPEDT